MSRMIQPRVLYVPNEAGDFRQLGFRRPFANLVAAGLIADVSVFSLQWRIRNGGDPEQHRQDLISRVREFRPNLVLMQHVGSTRLTDRHFQAMRKAGDFEFIYHEGDPYSRYIQPLPRAAGSAGRFADVVFTVGSGVFMDNFRRTGSSDVRWASHVFEPDRYHRVPVSPALTRPYDVVIVANRNSPRLRGHPNWRDRIRFVSHMQERFAGRIAIYGKGWSGVGAMGPIDFSSQDEGIRSAWVSANWDHYSKEPKYFSNRLPISLAAGSVHATTWHPGYDEVFSANQPFLILGKTPRTLADSIDMYLKGSSPSERITAGRQAQALAYSRYRQDDQLVSFLNFKAKLVDPKAASSSWDLESKPLTEL